MFITLEEFSNLFIDNERKGKENIYFRSISETTVKVGRKKSYLNIFIHHRIGLRIDS